MTDPAPTTNARIPKTGAVQIAAAERRAKALELRKAGLTYEQIGQTLGVTTRRAGYIVKDALEALTREPAQAVIDLELARLDSMVRGLWADARAGDVQAVDRVVRIMDRRARYLGLDHVPGQERDTSALDDFLRHMSGGTINFTAPPPQYTTEGDT